MEFWRRIYGILNNVDFSILGNVYLWPGKWMKLGGGEYFLVMAAGGIWLAATGLVYMLAIRKAALRTEESDSETAKSIFIWSAAFFLAWGAYVTFVYPPTTDEPHYLVIAESLAADGDVELAGNYAARDYRKFYPGRDIDPHTVEVPDGRMFSQHTAGLPLLILPGYATAGRWGVLAILAALAGGLVASIFALCRRHGSDRISSLLCCAGISTSVPLVFGATLVFTEVPAALLLSLGLAACGPGLAPAACGAALPWLHPRYALLSAGLAALCWLKSGPSRGRMARNWLFLVAIGGGLFLTVYHGPSLVSVLNVLTERYPARLEDLTASNLSAVSIRNPVTGAAGKLFDRDFGVLAYAPWLILLAAGILRAGKYRHAVPLIAGGGYILLTCLFRNWGGSAYPGRTLLPILPLAAPYLAQGLKWAMSGKIRARITWVLVAASWGVSLALSACPVLRYTSGREWLGAKLGPAAGLLLPYGWFPSFVESPQWGFLGGLTILTLGAWAVMRRRGRM